MQNSLAVPSVPICTGAGVGVARVGPVEAAPSNEGLLEAEPGLCWTMATNSPCLAAVHRRFSLPATALRSAEAAALAGACANKIPPNSRGIASCAEAAGHFGCTSSPPTAGAREASFLSGGSGLEARGVSCCCSRDEEEQPVVGRCDVGGCWCGGGGAKCMYSSKLRVRVSTSSRDAPEASCAAFPTTSGSCDSLRWLFVRLFGDKDVSDEPGRVRS